MKILISQQSESVPFFDVFFFYVCAIIVLFL